MLARNWRVRRYELDLIVVRGDLVAFVEVKTRRAGPADVRSAVGPGQRRRIRRAAEAWLHDNPTIGREFRFDLVTVEFEGEGPPRVRHIEAAFWGEEAL